MKHLIQCFSTDAAGPTPGFRLIAAGHVIEVIAGQLEHEPLWIVFPARGMRRPRTVLDSLRYREAIYLGTESLGGVVALLDANPQHRVSLPQWQQSVAHQMRLPTVSWREDGEVIARGPMIVAVMGGLHLALRALAQHLGHVPPLDAFDWLRLDHVAVTPPSTTVWPSRRT